MAGVWETPKQLHWKVFTFLADGFPIAHRGSPSLINLYTPTPPETHMQLGQNYTSIVWEESAPLLQPPLAASPSPCTLPRPFSLHLQPPPLPSQYSSFPISSRRQPLGSGLFHCLPIFSPLGHPFFFWWGSGVHPNRFCSFYPAYLDILRVIWSSSLPES